MTVTIRPMRATDVAAAASVVLRGDWGDRTAFFRFAASHPVCLPFVATVDGELAGTAVGTASGAAGWVGAIFVDAAYRGRGVGGALTDVVIEALVRHGCRTLVLVATSAGRSMYERRGFVLDTTYHTLEASGLDDRDTMGGALAAFEPADLDDMVALDRAATGEDRRSLLEAFSTPDSARCLRDADGTLRGFVVRAPWGGGATIAADPADAIRVLQARRLAAGAGRRVRAGVLAENHEGRRLLEANGWTEAWHAPRLIRGARLDWRPQWIWGQFNHALG